MAIGDKALARNMRLTPGTVAANTIDDEINRALDYIADMTAQVVAVANGGTAASTPAAARTNLGFPELGAPDQASPNRLPVYNGTSQLTSADPVAGGHVANKQWVDLRESYIRSDLAAAIDNAKNDANNNANGRVSKGGDTMSGDLRIPGASAASSGWTVAYFNGDGRLSKGTSSLRYKDLLADPDVHALGDIWPTLRQYAMKGGDGKPTLGYIAEEIAANPDTQRYAVYQAAENAEGEWTATDVVDSIDFIQLLIAQTAQLHLELTEARAHVDVAFDYIQQLEARIGALEAHA